MSTLFVVATPIGNLDDMTPRARRVLREVSLIAAEDTRHSGKMLHTFGIETPMISYHHHNRTERLNRILDQLSRADVALISDAGTPAVADPGHELVEAAAAAGHRIVPVPGASALLAAVSGSGLVPGPFIFLGFLPRSGEERRMALGKALTSSFAIVLFESPLRVVETLREIEELAPGRQAVIGRELTKLHEEFRRGTVLQLAGVCERLPLRGEVVIVIGEGTAGDTGSSDGEEAIRLARTFIEQGVKPSRAARELASILGLDSADAYAIVQAVTRQRTDP